MTAEVGVGVEVTLIAALGVDHTLIPLTPEVVPDHDHIQGQGADHILHTHQGHDQGPGPHPFHDEGDPPASSTREGSQALGSDPSPIIGPHQALRHLAAAHPDIVDPGAGARAAGMAVERNHCQNSLF